MKTYLEGLYEAHRLIREEHSRLQREHLLTPGNWLGQPTKRHYEILGASEALLTVATRIYNVVNTQEATQEVIDV